MRVLPSLILEPGLVTALVLDIAVTVSVPVVVNPRQRGAGRAFQLVDEAGAPGPTFALVEEDEKERRRVGRAVVGRVRSLLERGQLAEADLVEDLSGLFVAKRVDPLPLLCRQDSERRLRELGRERECLVAGQEAVAAEDSHEPGQ